MTLTQEEAFQSVTDRFPTHTVELNGGRVVVDGKQLQLNWLVDDETWNSSYCDIPASAELEQMLYESIYFHINGKFAWEEDHE